LYREHKNETQQNIDFYSTKTKSFIKTPPFSNTMKHTWTITIILVLIFLATQVFGLFTVNKYIEVLPPGSYLNGTQINKTIILHNATIVGEAPDVAPSTGFVYVLTAIAAGTVLLLLLIKFRGHKFWAIWFFFAVLVTTAVTLGVYFQRIPHGYVIALVTAAVLAFIKIYRQNIIIHNITEIFMYTGIAVLFVSFFNILWATILLIAISIYDIIAVWHSRHMVKMAKFTMESKLFAGIYFPYKSKKARRVALQIKKTKKIKNLKRAKIGQPKNAILGGGDIAFPLLFSAVVMESLILKNISPNIAFLQTLIISFTTTSAILLLFIFGKRDRYYPAMPFVTTGCLFGYLMIILLF